MNKTVEKCICVLYILVIILGIHSEVSMESQSYPLRSQRQAEGKCQRLEKPAHGNYIDLFNTSLKQPTLPLKTVLWYICDEGYQLFPKNILLICLNDGGWSQKPPTCLKLCELLYDTNSATNSNCYGKSKVDIKYDQATDGVTSTETQTVVPGDQAIVLWSSSGTLWGRTCQRLEKPANGKYIDLFNTSLKEETLPINTVLWYICDEGYQLFPKNTLLICLKDGGWSEDPPTCVKLCAPLYDTAATTFSCSDERKSDIGCDQATHGATATASCGINFVPNKNSSHIYYCRNGIWDSPSMQCKEVLCPPLYHEAATNFTCFDENETEISCDQASHHGFTATARCGGYYKPNKEEVHYCRNGVWEIPPMQCTPDCGKKRESATPLIHSGKVVEAGYYPWVAAIYQKFKNKFNFICGGTILTQTIIVTAAACVTDRYGNEYSAEIMKVVVGKYHNKFNDDRDTMTQYSNVGKILVHPKYGAAVPSGQPFGFNNIAILVTEDILVLSQMVQPACFSNSGVYLSPKSERIIAGWGYATDSSNPSEELTDIQISDPDSFINCTTKLPPYWLTSSDEDKFCAGYSNNTTKTCNVANGNGLVFKDPEDGRFYLHGVFSFPQTRSTTECIRENAFMYAMVPEHYDWLRHFVKEYDNMMDYKLIFYGGKMSYEEEHDILKRLMKKFLISNWEEETPWL